MNVNTQIKSQAVLSSPVDIDDAGHGSDGSIEYGELWKVIRGILVIWAVGVWALLVMMPGVQQINDIASAMLHLPYVFIGLGLIGAIFAAYNLRSDGHMIWFLGVLLLLAGWM
ncbi:MAG: Unknown protein [uncultured Thiotrichaceae bacterium]|uniref:Uncharacterized protein n=1 Tax=uncultured Thiotrichaceae bacterium TaxID=298394 RepID=A0A6S6T1Y1_9GAMM|nr:MAG: Unknown protein [uncultured Thiotrichaceae bacterium]